MKLTEKQKEQLTKLPKWVQVHLRDLERQREEAIRSLDGFTARQRPSKIWTEDWICDGESRGPTTRKFFVQSNSVNILHNEIELRILCRDEGIDLSWSGPKYSVRDVPMIPKSSNEVYLVHPKDLYGWSKPV
jgi:hypothetical protein